MIWIIPNYYKSNAKIEFQDGTEKAIVVGNTFKGTPIIEHGSNVQIAQSANL